jgi:hypothetical protein
VAIFLKGGLLSLLFGLPLWGLYSLVARSFFGTGHLVSSGLLGGEFGAILMMHLLAGGATALLTDRFGTKLSSVWVRLFAGAGFGALFFNLSTAILRFDTYVIMPCVSPLGYCDHKFWIPDGEPVRTAWVFLAALATGLTCGAFVGAWTYRGEAKEPLLSRQSVAGLFAGCLALSWVGYAMFWEIAPPQRMVQP